MTTHAEGTFENKGWDESTVSEFDDAKISHASVKQSFSGVIEGDADVDWHMYYAPDGTATFVGLQRIDRRDRRPQGFGRRSSRPGCTTARKRRATGSIVGATGELTGLQRHRCVLGADGPERRSTPSRTTSDGDG